MTLRRPNLPSEMDLNLHCVSRSLVARAKSRAASLGLTLKEWITSLIERALGDPARSPVTVIRVPVDADDTVAKGKPAPTPRPAPPPSGRRDL